MKIFREHWNHPLCRQTQTTRPISTKSSRKKLQYWTTFRPWIQKLLRNAGKISKDLVLLPKNKFTSLTNVRIDYCIHDMKKCIFFAKAKNLKSLSRKGKNHGHGHNHGHDHGHGHKTWSLPLKIACSGLYPVFPLLWIALSARWDWGNCLRLIVRSSNGARLLLTGRL